MRFEDTDTPETTPESTEQEPHDEGTPDLGAPEGGWPWDEGDDHIDPELVELARRRRRARLGAAPAADAARTRHGPVDHRGLARTRSSTS